MFGQFDPSTDSSDFTATAFLIQQALLKMQTITLVKVLAVHGGGVGPVGSVDVQPLVNQMTGDRTAVAHGTIFGIPYFRVQGGDNAIVCDPHVGDVGLCAFASRDISAVKATRAVANPGSFRAFDWADGLYFGGFLNLTPTQYLSFDGTGIKLVSPVKVTVQAPVIEIDGSGGTTIDGKNFLAHEHTGVQTGGGTSGPVA